MHKKHEKFSLRVHVPHYSFLLLRIIQTPILIYFAVAGNIVLFAGAFLFFKTELGANPNITTLFDAVWWAFCTVSTVGYGDIVPVTQEGRILGIFLMVFGVSFFVGFTAILVTIVITVVTKEVLGEEEVKGTDLQKIHQRLDKLAESIEKVLQRKA